MIESEGIKHLWLQMLLKETPHICNSAFHVVVVKLGPVKQLVAAVDQSHAVVCIDWGWWLLPTVSRNADICGYKSHQMAKLVASVQQCLVRFCVNYQFAYFDNDFFGDFDEMISCNDEGYDGFLYTTRSWKVFSALSSDVVTSAQWTAHGPLLPSKPFSTMCRWYSSAALSKVFPVISVFTVILAFERMILGQGNSAWTILSVSGFGWTNLCISDSSTGGFRTDRSTSPAVSQRHWT